MELTGWYRRPGCCFVLLKEHFGARGTRQPTIKHAKHNSVWPLVLAEPLRMRVMLPACTKKLVEPVVDAGFLLARDSPDSFTGNYVITALGSASVVLLRECLAEWQEFAVMLNNKTKEDPSQGSSRWWPEIRVELWTRVTAEVLEATGTPASHQQSWIGCLEEAGASVPKMTQDACGW
eukprot:gene11654-13764_t